MDALRKEVDKCSNLQGFFVFHAFGGGTGSGVGVELLDSLRENFAKKPIMQPVIYPSNDFASSVVEPYNCELIDIFDEFWLIFVTTVLPWRIFRAPP